MKKLTEEEMLEVVRREPSAFKYITNATEKVQIEAIKKDPKIMDIINYPSEEVKNEYLRMILDRPF